jgi:hypothetical protein
VFPKPQKPPAQQTVKNHTDFQGITFHWNWRNGNLNSVDCGQSLLSGNDSFVDFESELSRDFPERTKYDTFKYHLKIDDLQQDGRSKRWKRWRFVNFGLRRIKLNELYFRIIWWIRMVWIFVERKKTIVDIVMLLIDFGLGGNAMIQLHSIFDRHDRTTLNNWPKFIQNERYRMKKKGVDIRPVQSGQVP